MEFINDALHKGLELFRLDPWRYGLIIYGVIGFIFFVFRLLRKEDETNSVVPKIVAAVFIGLIWIRWLYAELWDTIGYITTNIIFVSTWIIIVNIIKADHPITQYINTFGFGTISDIQTNLVFLAMILIAAHIGYVFIRPRKEREFKRLAFEQEQRRKAADLNSPDKWNKGTIGR